MGGLPIALLLLADGRLPAGGHVHSGGVEQAIDTGRVTDLATLASWLVSRTRTIGRVEATLTAAAAVVASPGGPAGAPGCAGAHPWEGLIAEADARSPVPALRAASRSRGRAFVRVAEAAFDALELPEAARDPGLPLPLATGVVVARLGYAPIDAAALTLHGSAAEPAQAAVRRLGLDPIGITRLLVQLEPTMRTTAEQAVAIASRTPASWPATATPRFDLDAAAHAGRDDRYFTT